MSGDIVASAITNHTMVRRRAGMTSGLVPCSILTDRMRQFSDCALARKLIRPGRPTLMDLVKPTCMNFLLLSAY